MRITAGVDEAGRGPIAGAVVAAAVIIPKGFDTTGIDDSKKLSIRKRQLMFEKIITHCDYGVGIASNEEIDSVNILQATFIAMRRAVQQLKTTPDYILVDGNQDPAFGIPTTAVVGGDGIHSCIAAASIIAKVTRDKMMAELHEKFPSYNWQKNQGYPTREHINALTTHGITPYHRRTFAPVAAILVFNEL